MVVSFVRYGGGSGSRPAKPQAGSFPKLRYGGGPGSKPARPQGKLLPRCNGGSGSKPARPLSARVPLSEWRARFDACQAIVCKWTTRWRQPAGDGPPLDQNHRVGRVSTRTSNCWSMQGLTSSLCLVSQLFQERLELFRPGCASQLMASAAIGVLKAHAWCTRRRGYPCRGA